MAPRSGLNPCPFCPAAPKHLQGEQSLKNYEYLGLKVKSSPAARWEPRSKGPCASPVLPPPLSLFTARRHVRRGNRCFRSHGEAVQEPGWG